MSFGKPLSDNGKRSGGFLSGLFRRKKRPRSSKRSSMSDGTDNVTVIINTADVVKKRSASPKRKHRSGTKRTKPKGTAQTAAPKKATPKRKPAKKKPVQKAAPKRKRRTAPATANKPVSRAIQRRRAKRQRREEQSGVSIAAFGSTKRRLGLNDEENTDALMDDVTLEDCSYSEEENTAGMADKEPTDTEAKKINRINERLREFEGTLGVKYRAAYSSRNDKGYVLRKFVATSDKLETWGDPYIKLRPVGIGGKTLERVFQNKHGMAWSEFAKESAGLRELRSKLEKHHTATTKAEREKAEAAAIKARAKEQRELKILSKKFGGDKQFTDQELNQKINSVYNIGYQEYKEGLKLHESHYSAKFLSVKDFWEYLSNKQKQKKNYSKENWISSIETKWEEGWLAAKKEAEAAAIKARAKEQREQAKQAKKEAEKTNQKAESKAKEAKVQEQKAEKAEKTAKVAKAKAKKEPTKTNKAAAKKAEKKAEMEERKAEVLEKEAEKLEKKAEAAEEKADDADSALDKEILELAKLFAS